MTIPKSIRVSEAELRKLFNESGYWARVQAGELREWVLQNNHPSMPKANEPLCTKSQIVEYRTLRGEKVARVHRYLRKDGTLGASGKPDPKSVLIGETLYILVGH